VGTSVGDPKGFPAQSQAVERVWNRVKKNNPLVKVRPGPPNRRGVGRKERKGGKKDLIPTET